MAFETATFAEDRPHRSEHDRAMFAEEVSAHLPAPDATVFISDDDLKAIKAAFIRRFDEDLPRTETLMAVAHIGYRMALRDIAQGKIAASLLHG